MGFNGYHVAQIVIGAGWDKKVKWIEENYQDYQQYNLTPARMSKYFNTENWEKRVTQWKESLPLLNSISRSNGELSPFVAQYLVRLIFNGISIEEVTSLYSKSQSDSLQGFTDKISSLAGIHHAGNIEEVLAALQPYGYTENEVGMYLKALNKNKRGLVRWYNTGEQYSLMRVSLDEMRNIRDYSLSPAEMAERQENFQRYLQLLAPTESEAYFWKKVIVEYNGDLELLDSEERDTFNGLVQKLKEKQPLLAELYDLLKD